MFLMPTVYVWARGAVALSVGWFREMLFFARSDLLDCVLPLLRLGLLA